MKVRFRYLEKTFQGININKSIKKFISAGKFLDEEYRKKFEQKISLKYKRNCVAVSSGTNALFLILKSLKLKKNDEVLVPCLSWLSTFAAVKYAGGIPVGVDINDDLQMSIDDLEKKITSKTRAVIFVHFTGLVTDLIRIKKICSKKKITLIEDAAQVFGGRINNKLAGTFGDFSMFSFNPMKILNSTGHMGIILFKKKKLRKLFETYLYVGTVNKEKAILSEINHKADNFQMMFVTEKMNFLQKLIRKRINIAKLYEEKLTNKISKPILKQDFSHIYYDYVIQTNYRDELKKFLTKKKIEVKIRHPYLIGDHRPFKQRNNSYHFKSGTKIVKKILNLPIDENLNLKQVNYIIKTINNFFKNKK